jgi:hypothetical protein
MQRAWFLQEVVCLISLWALGTWFIPDASFSIACLMPVFCVGRVESEARLKPRLPYASPLRDHVSS